MEKNKKLVFAIIGTGNISSEHISALQNIDGAEVSYIYGRNESALKELAKKYNLSWTTDYQSILNNPLIDVIDIVLPSGLHAEYGIKAAQAGKHVVVEKPIDVTLESAEELINVCNEKEVTLGVISQMRFSDGMQKIYDYITNGKLGDIIQGDAYIKWYRSMEYYNSGEWRGTKALDGGGPFINQAIHFIDLLLSVMGPVKNVTAKTRTVNHDIEVEDIGVAMVEFESGAHGIIQAATAIFPGLPARLEIHGTKGTVIFENDNIIFEHIEGKQPFLVVNDAKIGGAADPKNLNSDLFIREFEDIISAINQKRQPTVCGEEAYKALQLILAIYESSDSGESIEL